MFCDVGVEICKQSMLLNHLVQVIQQSIVLGSSFVLYVISSEIGVIYTVLRKVRTALQKSCVHSLKNVFSQFLHCAYVDELVILENY